MTQKQALPFSPSREELRTETLTMASGSVKLQISAKITGEWCEYKKQTVCFSLNYYQLPFIYRLKSLIQHISLGRACNAEMMHAYRGWGSKEREGKSHIS